MPNCDFYATLEDHREVLDLLFSDRLCRVFETSSDFETSLVEFTSTDAVLHQFSRSHSGGTRRRSVHLNLYVHGSGPPFEPTKVGLNPELCGGASYRYSAQGWGLVQLYLSIPHAGELAASHTNHNSLKRAQKWSKTSDELGNPSAWDFSCIQSFSSRLNRQIRKFKVARIGSRVILPGALAAWDTGVNLGPYKAGIDNIDRLDGARKVGGSKASE